MHGAPGAGCQALKHCPGKGEFPWELRDSHARLPLRRVPNPIHTPASGGAAPCNGSHERSQSLPSPFPLGEARSQGGQGARAPGPGWGADLGIEEGYTRTAQKAWSHPPLPPPAPQSSHPEGGHEADDPKGIAGETQPGPQPGGTLP